MADYTDQITEFEKELIDFNHANKNIPEWMRQDRTVDGFVVDTVYTLDTQDYETMAFRCNKKGNVTSRAYGDPVVELHAKNLVQARFNHKKARKMLRDMKQKSKT